MKTLNIIIFMTFLIVFGCKTETTDNFPPEDVSGLKLTYGDSSILLTWTDPIDKDLYNIEVTSYGYKQTVPKGIEFLEIQDLEVGKNYLFTVKTIDQTGNKSIGIQIEGKIDYRFKYTGEFEFFSFNWYGNYPEIIYDSMIFVGNISIVEEYDSVIKINYRSSCQGAYCVDGKTIEPIINPTGVFHDSAFFYCYGGNNNGFFYGTDSLEISILTYASEGMGNWGQIIKGKRVK